MGLVAMTRPTTDCSNEIHEIPLEQIRPAPWNPPARMDGATVEELADSILAHGQQIPALVRPVEADGPIQYELVFGHRRYAAQRLIAERDISTAKERRGLKTFIRPLSEADAMIISGIENLQRKGFSDVEEAEFFRTCGARYGDHAVKMLAEKLSVSERYVRKRIRILELPERALKMWREGEWHVGHMEQLLRVSENVEAFLDKLERRNLFIADLGVWQLKGYIDKLAIPLAWARFDKAECKTCGKNTKVQLTLFGGEKDKDKCLDGKCFEKKQRAWFDVCWQKCKQNKFGTLAVANFRDVEPTGYFDTEGYAGRGAHSEKCEACPQFVSLIDEKGDVCGWGERACLGDKKCYQVNNSKETGATQEKMRTPAAGGAGGDSALPRVEWHGEHFRQEFYAKEAPGLCADLLIKDPKRLQLALAAFCYRHRSHLAEWLFGEIGGGIPEEIDRSYQRGHTLGQFLEGVKKLSPLKVEHLLAEAVIVVAFHRHGNYSDEFEDDDRAAIARFLGVDFGKWEPTDEWFAKKTKGELIRYIVQESGLMKEEAFRSYAGKRRGFDEYKDNKGIISAEKLATEKKACLVDLIKNCGVDLAGRLPEEIEG